MSQQLAITGFFESNKLNTESQNQSPVSNNIISLEDFITKTSTTKNTDNNSFKVKAQIVADDYIKTVETKHNPTDAFSVEEVKLLLDYLYSQNGKYPINDIRNLAYITLSVNVARRVSDILNLRIGDVVNIKNGVIEIADHLCLKEQKTDKYARVKINSYAREALKFYLEKLGQYNHAKCLPASKLSDWLFPQCYNREKPTTPDSMRKMIKRLIDKIRVVNKDFADRVNENCTELFNKHYGTHSLRKTIARNVIDNSNDVKDIQLTTEFLGHSSQKITSTYLNIQREELDDYAEKFGIGISLE